MLRQWVFGILVMLVAQAAGASVSIKVVGLFKNAAMVEINGEQLLLKQNKPGPHGVALQCRTVCPPQEFRATFLEHKNTELFLSVGLS